MNVSRCFIIKAHAFNLFDRYKQAILASNFQSFQEMFLSFCLQISQLFDDWYQLQDMVLVSCSFVCPLLTINHLSVELIKWNLEVTSDLSDCDR